MALKYRLVLRPDMSKKAVEGSKLFYGQIRSQDKVEFKKFCELVSGHCTATKGEVELVIDGMLYVMRDLLDRGSVIQLGEFGNFRMMAGSKGAAVAKDFDTSLFKKGRIVFIPGARLKELTTQTRFEKLDAFTEPTQPGGNESESPDEI